MGRLQRKKSAKKKKKTVVSTDISNSTGSTAAVAAVSAKSKAAKAQKASGTRKYSPVAKAAATKPKDNLLSKAIQFLREVKVELKKVTWPTRKQTVGSTVVVIILVMVIAFFLGAVDIGLSSLVKVILQ